MWTTCLDDFIRDYQTAGCGVQRASTMVVMSAILMHFQGRRTCARLIPQDFAPADELMASGAVF